MVSKKFKMGINLVSTICTKSYTLFLRNVIHSLSFIILYGLVAVSFLFGLIFTEIYFSAIFLVVFKVCTVFHSFYGIFLILGDYVFNLYCRNLFGIILVFVLIKIFFIIW